MCILCFQVSINNLWLGDELKAATDHPRFHHQLMPNEVFYEEDMNMVRCLKEELMFDSEGCDVRIVFDALHLLILPLLPGRGLNFQEASRGPIGTNKLT